MRPNKNFPFLFGAGGVVYHSRSVGKPPRRSALFESANRTAPV
jgi:hypothetical protein